VADCLSTDEGRGMGGLANDMVRRFSRRARHYVLAYFYIDHEQEKNMDEEGLHELNIERIKKEIKTHRSAIEFDEKFINHCFHKSDNEQKTVGSSERERRSLYKLTLLKILLLLLSIWYVSEGATVADLDGTLL
jgi:hypothetical protein